MRFIQNKPLFNCHPSALDTLQIDVTLATPPVFYQRLTLDAVLAYAVVQHSTHGQGLPDSDEPYQVPLPLATLWTCPDSGLPLWDATQFHPTLINYHQPAFWHKRGYKPQLLKKTRHGKFPNANFGNGVHKEYRIPMPLQTALNWRAYAKGNAYEIQRLLNTVNAIGKKRTQGYGKVLTWKVTTCEPFDYWYEGRLIKAFPVDFNPKPLPKGAFSFSIFEQGWTPPYWLATTFRECLS